MSRWPMVPFSSVGRLLSGGTPSKAKPEYWQGDIPWVSPKDMNGSDISTAEDKITETAVECSATRLVPTGTVLIVARSGILARKLPVGLTTVPVAFNQDIKALHLSPGKTTSEYVAWWLRAQEPVILRRGVKHGATVHSLTSGFLEQLSFPLPPLDEQRRIVDLLNRAAGIRRLREQALATARNTIPALFIQTFGDPATNPKGWPVVELGTLGELDRGKSRHRPRNDPQLLGGPHPFLQTGDVANSNGIIERFASTYSDFGLAQSRKWPKGTLCITIAANIAATGVLQFDACFPDSVVGFRPGPSVTSEYVQAIIDRAKGVLEQNAPQAAQKNINLKILRALPTPLPPLHLQRRFADRLADLRGIVTQQERALATARTLERALLARLLE